MKQHTPESEYLHLFTCLITCVVVCASCGPGPIESIDPAQATSPEQATVAALNTAMAHQQVTGKERASATPQVDVQAQEKTGGGPKIVEVKRSTKSTTWKSMASRTIEDLSITNPAAKPVLDAWGGRSDQSLPATGFFRTAQDRGRWTLVDPLGHPFISVGVNDVNPVNSDGAKKALKEQFGDKAGWATATRAQLQATGFNTLGCWSDYKTLAKAGAPMAYTMQHNVMSSFAGKLKLTFQDQGHTGYQDGVLPVFHPDWPAFCADYLGKRVEETKDDASLLGHFSDNELPFHPSALDRHLKLKPGSAGREAADHFLGERNRAPGSIDDTDRSAFLALYADAYFAPIAKTLRALDAKHLYLGSRFWYTDFMQESLFRVAGQHCDVVSVNWYYVWDPRNPDADRCSPQTWLSWSGKPCMITKWYAKAEDSGLSNITGAGWLVKTQADRGTFYQTFTLGLLEQAGCVGWHWFKYQDNDPTVKGAEPSNVNANKGLVTNRFKPWVPLIDAVTAVNTDVYRLRDHLSPTR